MVVEFDTDRCISEITAGHSSARRQTSEKDNEIGVAAPIRLRHNFKTRVTTLTAKPIAGKALRGGSYRTIKKAKPRIRKKQAPALVHAMNPIPRKRIVTAQVIKLK
jgi:hypothetical protein